MLSFGDLVCLDQRGGTVASYVSSNLAVQNKGKLTLAPGVGERLMDEIVVSGIAMLEYKR